MKRLLATAVSGERVPQDPADLAEEIIENIEAGLTNFRAVLAAIGK